MACPNLSSTWKSLDEMPHPSEFVEFVSIPPGSHARSGNINMRSVDRNGDVVSAIEAHVKVAQPNYDDFYSPSSAIIDLDTLSSQAWATVKAERKMTIRRAFRVYPRAMAWAALLSMTIVMEGYGKTLINSFFAFPVFRRFYGSLVDNDFETSQPHYEISTTWQTSLVNAAITGEILGLIGNGFLTDQFGYRLVMVGSLICLSLFVFLSFFAVNIQMLLAAQVLCGLPWGFVNSPFSPICYNAAVLILIRVFQTLSTTYAAEVMPVTLRAYLTSNINNCWLLGQLTGIGIIRAFINSSSAWAYRIPFALQWAFAIPILVTVFFAPESPCE